MVTKLRKAPLVTHALKKDNKSTGYGADSGDIFADFFGAQGGAAANQPKDVEADKKKIEERNRKGYYVEIRKDTLYFYTIATITFGIIMYTFLLVSE